MVQHTLQNGNSEEDIGDFAKPSQVIPYSEKIQ